MATHGILPRMAVAASSPQHPKNDWVSTVSAAVITGIFTIIASCSFAALIFSGPLQPFVGNGVWLMLMTGVISGVFVALTSSLRGVIAIPQDRIAPILVILVAGVVARMPDATPEQQCAAAVAAMGAVTLLTGAILYAFGRLKLGSLLQYVPYPVIGGFLAGSGWLLLLGGFRIALGHALKLDNLPQLFAADQLIKWIPAAAFGVTWFCMMKRSRHPFVPALLLLGGVVLFYAVIAATGVSLAQARTHGWLPAVIAANGVAPVHGYLPFQGVPWAALGLQANVLGTILLTSVVSVMLNASALELVSGQEVDINRELRCAGQASLLSGLGGGMPGFHSMSLSRLALSMGAAHRWTGVISGLLCAVALGVGPSLVAGIPQYICGGLIFFLGLTFLWEWVIEARHKLNRVDYVVVLLIVGVIGTLGYPQGVVTGVVAAIILFIHNYSRVDVVTHALSGAQLTSNVDRPVREGRLLVEQGDAICILKLQGFIFFGTASHLFEEIRSRVANPALPPLKFAVLDFRRVTGLDSSAIFSLRKAEQLARKRGFIIVLCQAGSDLLTELRAENVLSPDGTFLRVYPDLDHGLEACENEVLASSGTEHLQLTLAEQWADLWPAGTSLARLLPYLDRREIPAGEHLIRQGEKTCGLFFIESGRVTVRLELSDGQSIRLRTMGAGTVVGEVSLLLRGPRTASVITNEPCVVYGLSAEALARLEEADPALALAFHRFMSRLLAERVTNSTRAMRSLLE